jgi:hypothetical protein
MHTKLTCPKCSKPWILSEDDVVSFYPAVWCLGCSAKIPIPIEKEKYLELVKKHDRDRRVSPGK